MSRQRRQIKEKAAKTFITLTSMVGLVLLGLIFYFVLSRGLGLLSFDFLFGDYHPETYNLMTEEPVSGMAFEPPDSFAEDGYFSSRFGVGFADRQNFEGKDIVEIIHVDDGSPFASLVSKAGGETVSIRPGYQLDKVIFEGNAIYLSRSGAEHAAAMFDAHTAVADMMIYQPGQGIRGSLITTLWLIVIALVVAVPLGCLSGIYLHEFASPANRFTAWMKQMIDVLAGIPSIVFGLMGVVVFIPITQQVTNATGGNVIAGALTLAVIVLPIIINQTIESLKVIPDSLRQASLALGADHTQTTFRVVLKAAVPGILSAVLLSVGRIIGESAALIFVVGTAIKDEIILTERSTSLAVHIWSVMSGEVPNFEMASAISLVILMMVLVLNMSIKWMVRHFTYKNYGG